MPSISADRQEQLGVIFDMDGVLVETYQSHFQSWQAMAKEYGGTITEAEFVSFFGRTNREIIPAIWGSEIPQEQIAAMDDRKEVLYRELLRQQVPAKDGVRELVDDLRDAGFLLAVGSSGPLANVELTLRGLGRERSFRALATKDDLRHGKPNPEVFLLAAQRLGIVPSRCAVIEDAPAGVSAALAGGMTAIGLVGTVSAEKLSHAHLVVDSLRELSPERIARLIRRFGSGETIDEKRG